MQILEPKPPRLASSAVAIAAGCALLAPGCKSAKPLQVGLVDDAQVFDRGEEVQGLRLNLLAGRNKSVRGADVGTFFNRADEDSWGVQLVGVGNVVEGSYKGIQIAGLAGNRVGGIDSDGMTEEHCITGVQISGMVNFGNVRGLQIGYVNGLNFFAGERPEPRPEDQDAAGVLAQAMMEAIGEGVMFIADEEEECAGYVRGAQLGFANAATDVDGAQLSLLGNLSDGDLRGVQAGGIFNKAEDGAGVQIGLINVAGSLKGIQLGLWNANENGFLPGFPLINFGF